MPDRNWMTCQTPAFRLMIATSWISPASWQEKQEDAIREAIGENFDWIEYVRLVDRHRTPALSLAALKRVPGLEIPEAILRELKKRSDACRMQAVRHSIELVKLLKAFNRAEIPVMPLKGPLLSLDLYGDIGLRQSKDLDIAVNQEHIQAARICMENQGWYLDSTWFPLSPRQWESFLQHEHELRFLNPHGRCLLELHWRNQWDTPAQTSSRWLRSMPSKWQDCDHKVMHSIDQVLYLCCHGAEHAWIRAKWLGDLARIQAEGRVNWEAAVEEARRSGLERPLLACLRLLNEIYELPVPDSAENQWKDLPSFLVNHSRSILSQPTDGTSVSIKKILPQLFRFCRYSRLLFPQKPWMEIFAGVTHHRPDFKVLPLPDSLFWAYVPLRPVLWAWRRVKRNRVVSP